ncbi:MAG: lytic transglycosylase domain-containing protein [Alphaproteobacteria bacterium]|nr:lytic transglycosylase domain-containing protein [Alphaproteobacteria bacterium]
MHERDFNDRISSYLSQSPAKIGSFRRDRSGESYFGALLGDLSLLMLLVITTVGVIFAIQGPLGHSRLTIRIGAPREIFTNTFSAKLVQDQAELDRQKRRVAYLAEQHMTSTQLINRWKPYIAEASGRFRVPAAWIRAVIKMESGGRTMSAENKPITSPVGAVGLMQLMPGTYKEMEQQHRLGADPSNPHDNIMAGTAYLRWLHRKYGFPAMFVAYNDGPGNLEAKQMKGRALPPETQNYVATITAMLGTAAAKQGVRQAATEARAALRVRAQYS